MSREKLEELREGIYKCCRCGYCRDMVRARDNTSNECPLRENTGGFDSFTAVGRNWIARQVLEGRVNPEDFSEEFIDHLFSDLLCGNCTQHCGVIVPEAWDRFPDDTFDDNAFNINEITRALRGLVIQEGNPPPEIRDVLENISRNGNPQGKSRKKRGAFTKKLDFDIKDAMENECEILYYVGSIASYDSRNRKTARSVARILKAADADFGILGNKEEDSGSLAYDLGEMGLFEELAKSNLELFQEHNVKSIVCLSPHDYSSFQIRYPALLDEKWPELDINVWHYTEFITDLIDDGELSIESDIDKTVTYHDSCELGRRNQIYEAPREIIRATGANLSEMELSYENSYCCGGGGGSLWYEPLHEPKVENERVKQALETGVDILAVACPVCAQMLEDGLKAAGGEMEIMDVAEIVEETVSLE